VPSFRTDDARKRSPGALSNVWRVRGRQGSRRRARRDCRDCCTPRRGRHHSRARRARRRAG
jgi:hypothetical protein